MSEAEAPLEAYPEAAAILREAGWAPHDRWGVYTRGTLVMGFSPDGQHFDVKNWGLDVHGPDTPDDPVEAAQWLVTLRKPVQIEQGEQSPEEGSAATSPKDDGPSSLEALPEPEQTPAYESDGETGEEAAGEADLHDHASGNPASEDAGQSGGLGAGGELEIGDAGLGEGYGDAGGAAGVSEQDWGGGGDGDLQETIDADFTTDLPELGQELTEEHPEEFAGSQFIFGDNLEQKRTAAIGLVMRHARSLMPVWDAADDQRLVELRNFAAGVGEGRFTNSDTLQDDLAALEARLASMANIVKARDEKVEFLEAASREEIEAFDPEANWP